MTYDFLNLAVHYLLCLGLAAGCTYSFAYRRGYCHGRQDAGNYNFRRALRAGRTRGFWISEN